METPTINEKKIDAEIALSEKWFEAKYGGQVTHEQILKLLLYKLHQIEIQTERVNSIL